MKKMSVILYLIAISGFSISTNAQIVVPDESPAATIIQKIGSTDVRIDYVRPSVRGRNIFGSLVPFGKVWSAPNTPIKLYVGGDLIIEDKYTIHPGMYSVYIIPNPDEWTIIITKDSWWGIFGFTEINETARFTAKTINLKEQVETFTIDFANVCSNCAELQLQWDFTKVTFRISTSTDEKVLAQIRTFTSNPEARVAGEYYLSAKYYLDTDRDLNQAIQWIDKALALAPGAYWMTHTRAEILAKQGQYSAAIETAQLSIEQARMKKDDDYVRINEQEIAKWKEVKKNNRKGIN